jgi:hypothetical protein
VEENSKFKEKYMNLRANCKIMQETILRFSSSKSHDTNYTQLSIQPNGLDEEPSIKLSKSCSKFTFFVSGNPPDIVSFSLQDQALQGL